jgi:hypothetical protein
MTNAHNNIDKDRTCFHIEAANVIKLVVVCSERPGHQVPIVVTDFLLCGLFQIAPQSRRGVTKKVIKLDEKMVPTSFAQSHFSLLEKEKDKQASSCTPEKGTRRYSKIGKRE